MKNRGPVNRSSSFYSEEYYQKARKNAHLRRPAYRQHHKELYDQDPELDLKCYYYVPQGAKCQMNLYFDMINQVYMKLKQLEVRKNEEYNNSVEDFINRTKQLIHNFHTNMTCDLFLTRDQYIRLGLKSQQDLSNHFEQSNKVVIEQGRLWTCNLCPIYIEEFQHNFQRGLKEVMRNCDYWDQLNGRQKMNKFRTYIQQNLKVLYHQLNEKCEHSPSLGHSYKMRRPKIRRKRKQE